MALALEFRLSLEEVDPQRHRAVGDIEICARMNLCQAFDFTSLVVWCARAASWCLKTHEKLDIGMSRAAAQSMSALQDWDQSQGCEPSLTGGSRRDFLFRSHQLLEREFV